MEERERGGRHGGERERGERGEGGGDRRCRGGGGRWEEGKKRSRRGWGKRMYVSSG